MNPKQDKTSLKTSPPLLDDSALLRYSRQITLPQIGLQGQQLLQDSRVGIIGLGGLGAAVAHYLASSGVGHIELWDFDRVELSNLSRQPIHTEEDIGLFKSVSAANSIRAINPAIKCIAHCDAIDESQAHMAFAGLHLLLDCTDNFSSRQAINRVCHALKIPVVSAAVIRFEGQLTFFDYRDSNSPCYRCLYDIEQSQDTCASQGVSSTMVGILGTMQAHAAANQLMGIGESLMGQVLLLDGLQWQVRQIKLRKDTQCPVCRS